MSDSRATVISFRCADEDLIGILHEPQGAFSRSLGVLIVVGGPQYRVGSHRQFVVMGRQLAAAGYPVFRFDYRGMGDSTGIARNFESVDDDIRAAMEVFRSALPANTGIVVLGLCDAASAALMYCGRHSGVRGLVLLNPWVRTEEGSARVIVRHYYLNRLFQRSLWQKILARRFNAIAFLREAVGVGGRAWRSREPASEDSAPPFLGRMEDGLEMFRGPALVLLSGRDLTAREFEDLCARSKRWKKWITSSNVIRVRISDADHTYSSRSSIDEAISRITQWLVTAIRTTHT